MSSLLHPLRFAALHRWAPRHMSAYLDGELGSHGRTLIERHIGECDDCRALLASLRRTLDALHRLPAPIGAPDPVQIAASVRVRLSEPPGS